MRRSRIVLAALAALTLVGACSDFATAPEVEQRILKETGKEVSLKTVTLDIAGMT